MNTIYKTKNVDETYSLAPEPAMKGCQIIADTSKKVLANDINLISSKLLNTNVATIACTPNNMKAERNNSCAQVTDVNIIVPNKVVEVTFKDGKKEKSVCREPDVFSLEQAIGICISKKSMGGSSAYNNAIKRGMKVYEEKLREEQMEKEEQERIERKRTKKKAYKERRAAKREQAEREKQIEIQKEAYVRAMMEVESMKNKGV